jgi:phage terminase large subunit
MEKLHMMALVNPGMRGLICRKTATSLSSTALVTWRRFVVNDALLNGDVSYYGGSGQEPAQYKYRNGSVIAIGGLDKISKIMSAEYDVIYVQEATELTETDWEHLSTRLRNWVVSFQQLIGDCNPSAPTHWLKLRSGTGKVLMMETLHEDNPVLFDEVWPPQHKAHEDATKCKCEPTYEVTERGRSYLEKLDGLTGVRYQRLRLGRWVAAEGVIFEDFGEPHILDKIPVTDDIEVDPNGVPLSWLRYWSIDFGFVNPFVLQCWARDGDGRMYLYRELYMSHRTVDQHCREIITIVAPNGIWTEPKPVSIVADHDAEGRATFEQKLGMSTQPAHKSVLEGIDAVQVRLRDAGDGRPRLFILRSALVRKDPVLTEIGKPACTLEEIPAYVWADKQKEQPVKMDDHGCDALRYAIAEQDFGVRVLYRTVAVG